MSLTGKAIIAGVLCILQVFTDAKDGSVVLSEPKHTVSLMVDDTPLYVESESEISEDDVRAMDRLTKKIKKKWKGVIKPCKVLIQRLSALDVERLQKRFKIGPICVPLALPDTDKELKIELISETDFEMFPEDTGDVTTDGSSSDLLLGNKKQKMATPYIESLVPDEKQENVGLQPKALPEIQQNGIGSEVLQPIQSAFDVLTTEIDSQNKITRRMSTSTELADEMPNKLPNANSNTLVEGNYDHMTQEDDDLVDSSQSLFDEVQIVDEEVTENKNGDKREKEETKDSETHSEHVVDKTSEEDAATIITSDVEENKNKIEEEPGKEEGNNSDDDEVLSLRPESDSESEEDVPNLLSNSGEDETCILNDQVVDNTDDSRQSEVKDYRQGSQNRKLLDGQRQRNIPVESTKDAGPDSTNDFFDEVPDSPVMDLLPDKSDSEPDEEEWVNRSKMESAVEDSDLTALDDSEITNKADDDKEEEKLEEKDGAAEGSGSPHSNSDEKAGEPESTGKRRTRLSLSAKKKSRSEQMKSAEPTSESETSKRVTRSSPLTVELVGQTLRRSVRNDRNKSPDTERQEKEDRRGKEKGQIKNHRKNEDENESREQNVKQEDSLLDSKEDDDDLFTRPLSQKSNGFTIETKLINADEVTNVDDTHEDHDITLSQMPILIESSDDEESTVLSDSEQILSDSEYHSLFVIDSDDEEVNVEVKKERERRTSGYGSDLEMIGEEKIPDVKVKDEKEEESEVSMQTKISHTEAELHKVSPNEIDEDTVDSCTTGSSEGDASTKSAPPISSGQGIDHQKENSERRNDSLVLSDNKMPTEGFVKHNVDLSEMADDEVRKFLDGAFLSQSQTEKKTEGSTVTAREDESEDSSDDESFEDLEGDFLHRKELERKKLAEEQAKKAQLTEKVEVTEKQEMKKLTQEPADKVSHTEKVKVAEESDFSDDEDEDLEGDFLSRKAQEKKLQQNLQKDKELSKSEIDSEKQIKAMVHEQSKNDRDKGRSEDIVAVEERAEDVVSVISDEENVEDIEEVTGATDEDSDSGEVTFKPGTPKMNEFKEFNKESSPEETLPDIPGPNDAKEKIRKRILSEDSESDNEEFLSIPSGSFYKKDNQKSLRERLGPPRQLSKGPIKKPVGMMTNEDLRKAQRMRGGKGRDVKTTFEIQSDQIARAKAQLKERESKNKGMKEFLFTYLKYENNCKYINADFLVHYTMSLLVQRKKPVLMLLKQKTIMIKDRNR